MEIRADRVTKAYGGLSVLKDVTFTAGPGITWITGPSGVGKTTLLRILLGLEQPDGGAVFGAETLRWAAVFQEDRLLEHLDAARNLRFALGPYCRWEEAAALLTELGLSQAADKPVRTYSGGMRRRLALVRALLAPHDALALDEPFSGLDRENRDVAMEAIRRREAGKIVLLVTHEPDPEGLAGQRISLGHFEG